MSAPLARLKRRGAAYRDPFTEIDFDAADPAAPWLPEELLSLAPLPRYAAMSRAQRLRLSRIDFARLCAAGVWLEGLLVSRVAARGFVGVPFEEACVTLQEVREEAGHSLMFLEMIERAGLSGVALLGPTRLLTSVARRLGPEDAEFWAMVYIGESVTHQFVGRALRLRASGEPICPLARAVMTLHHRDEARHLAVARTLLEARAAEMGGARRCVFAATLRFLLRCFTEATLYPTPASLAALGIDEPARVAREVRRSPERTRLARACAAPALSFIARAGLATPTTQAP